MENNVIDNNLDMLEQPVEDKPVEDQPIDYMALFISKYNPEIYVTDPVYKFKIDNGSNELNFYCYYHKKNLKIYFGNDCPLGNKVFDKDNIEFSSIDNAVLFCKNFLEEYSKL